MARSIKRESAPPAPADPLEQARLEVADIFANIAEFWGFTRTQGRIFGFVFMSAEPVAQSQIRESLSISAGSASMTITSLVEWGVLHREGRLYYAETDFWKLITTVMRRREREEIEDAIERVREIADLLGQSPDHPNTEFARKRVAHLLGFFEMGRNLLDAVVRLSPVHKILESIARTASKLRPNRPKPADSHAPARH